MAETARPSITAFFPCYNDSGTIASVVITADRTLRVLADDYEIIVGDDASTDNSVAILEELRRLYPRLRVLHHAANRGYGGNLRSMFAEATKDLIFYTDGDAQYDPAELTLLYQHLGADVDVVQGWKIERHDPLHRKIIGRVYHHFVRRWFGLHLRDVDCDFRLFRRQVLFTVEMMTRIEQGGFSVVEVPVHHYHRAYGESQFFNFRRVARTLTELSRLWIRLKLLPRRDVSGAATPPRSAA
ncbi:MAG: glycosyltransferase family 2 protein [Chloroflexi bacterium]|nr:MAG: glycosyltransferase family 2 protein [Chloroflexota bacterium]